MRLARRACPPLSRPSLPFFAAPSDGPYLHLFNGLSFPPSPADLVRFNFATIPSALLSPTFSPPQRNDRPPRVWQASAQAPEPPKAPRRAFTPAIIISPDVPFAYENVFRPQTCFFWPHFHLTAWRLTGVWGDGRISSAVLVRPSAASPGWNLDIVLNRDKRFKGQERNGALTRADAWGRVKDVEE
ncbi:hypothetical protein JCM11641_003914 [Rhodosporidiobolus odoratus]